MQSICLIILEFGLFFLLVFEGIEVFCGKWIIFVFKYFVFYSLVPIGRKLKLLLLLAIIHPWLVNVVLVKLLGLDTLWAVTFELIKIICIKVKCKQYLHNEKRMWPKLATCRISNITIILLLQWKFIFPWRLNPFTTIGTLCVSKVDYCALFCL